MVKANQTHSKETDEHTFWGMLLGFLLIGGLISYFEKNCQILFGLWKAIYLPQAQLLAWCSNTFLGKFINELVDVTPKQASKLLVYMTNTSSHELTWPFCKEASHFIGKYLSIFLIPIGAYLAFKTHLTMQGNTEVYRHFSSANELFKHIRNHKPQGFQLSDRSKEDIYKGNYAHAKSPYQFAEENKLIDKDSSSGQVVAFNSKKATKIFVNQLGASFTTLDNLFHQPYGWVAKKIIKKIPQHHHEDAIEFATNGHLFDSTVLVSLLIVARRFGVVPLALFANLKSENRALWYALTNVGRQVVFVEGAGITAQYNYECALKLQKKKAKKNTNSISHAVEGLANAVLNEHQDFSWKENRNIWQDYKPS